MDSSGGISKKYATTILLELIRSECEEVPGFPYLTKKCYLAEKMRNLDLFGFSHDSNGASSDLIEHAIERIESLNLARVTKIGDAICRFTKNYCGERCQEHIALCDEQVTYQYLDSIANHPDLREWQEVIDIINRHPSGKNWHTLSVAVHLHSHRQVLPKQRVISDIKKRATEGNTPLPKNVFDDAVQLLTDLNLPQTP